MSKFAFVFPGQGSQSVGMMQHYYDNYQIVKDTFTEANEVLGYDLWALISEGPAEKLNETQCTQPALLAAGVACWRAYLELGGEYPDYLAGHSLGEYAALVCSGALSFADGIKLVAARGQYMQEAVPAGTGAMAAIIGLDDELVEEVCRQASERGSVTPANFNSVGQVVIAGVKEAVDYAVELAKPAGAKLATLIPVSVPSHCELMLPAAQKLAGDLVEISLLSPSIPVVNNVDVAIENDDQKIKDALIRQLSKPVQWVKTVQFLQGQGVEVFVECGPGKVLSGLIKRIDRALQTKNLSLPEQMQELING